MSKEFIGPLHGLRGIAAITVVVGHSASYTGIPLPAMAPAMGVLLFFALSGFLMAHLYIHREASATAVGEYVVARFARIYPLFTTVCILSSIFYYAISTDFSYQLDISGLIYHLLGAGSARTIWTISTEFQFYLLFVFFWLAYSQMGENRRVKFSCVLLLIIFFLWLVGFPGGRIAITGYLQVFLAGILAEFSLSLVSRSRAKSIASMLLPIMLLVYIAAFFIAPRTIGQRWVYHEMSLVAAMALLVWSATVGADSALGKLLSIRPMLWLGEISFGTYLLHRPVLFFLGNYLPEDLHWVVKNILLFSILFIICHLAYKLIERPSRSKLKGISQRYIPRSTLQT